MLRRIQAFHRFFNVLVGWDGEELTIDSCPFLNEAFVKRLRRVMVDSGEALWPGANIYFDGYGYGVWRRLDEFLDLRWQLEGQ